MVCILFFPFIRTLILKHNQHPLTIKINSQPYFYICQHPNKIHERSVDSKQRGELQYVNFFNFYFYLSVIRYPLKNQQKFNNNCCFSQKGNTSGKQQQPPKKANYIFERLISSYDKKQVNYSLLFHTGGFDVKQVSKLTTKPKSLIL